VILPDDDHGLRAGGTASLAGPARSNLAMRVASAALLAPLALATAYWDSWPFLMFWTLAALGIYWEWTGLVAKTARLRELAPGLALVIAAALILRGQTGFAIAIVAIAALIAAGLAADRRVWVASGMIYAGVAFFGPVVIRHDVNLGFAALLFLFAVVWATDILGYAVGRLIGGPLLWPRVSPKKTWSGAIGGTAGAVAAGIAVAYAVGIGNLEVIAALGMFLSVLSQGGDLFESAVKRHFAAKDASGLIPGHGGVMDRLDGFLVAALAAALIGVLRQGLDAPAAGLLIW
jgi:phosphatidate cytidylyltransferase